ncbi:MAG: hypothetical protein SNI45_03750 [Rikenellaceae bacterium]
MKRLLYFLVSLLIVVSCSQLLVDVDDAASLASSSEAIFLTVEASISNDSQSRISVSLGEDSSQDWTLAWDEDDRLIMIEVDSYLICYLDITSIDPQTGIATFGGEVTEGEYNVYSAQNYSIADDGQIIIDYSSQGDDCSNPPMSMDGTLKITGGSDFTSISLDHMAQALDLRISFDDLVDNDTYTLHSATIDGTDYQFGTVIISTSKELTSDNNTCSLYCYLPAFTVAAGGSITTTAALSSSAGEIYFATAVTTNTTDAEIAFQIGNHNYLTARFDLDETLDATSWSDNAASSFDSGEGSASNPYLISTPSQLAKLSVDVSDGNLYTDVYFELKNSIDLTGNLWSTIGTVQTQSFRGIFDGAGYTISGLYINSSSNSQGLFGCIYGATIKNLTVDGLVRGANTTGGVVGVAYNGSTIDYCINRCTVIGNNYVGGVAGSLDASSVNECDNFGSVSGANYVGGAVGYIVNKSSVGTTSNFGAVSGTTYVGGVAGSNESYSVILSSCNMGSVSGGSGGYVGGVTGYNYTSSQVTFSYNEASVDGQSTYTAGVVGYNNDSSIITSCYNKGEVYGKSDYVGGVVGDNRSSSIIVSCYNTGSISGNGERVGGVAGNSVSSTVTCCYSAASVGGTYKVGALVGYASSTSTISTCYWGTDLEATALGSGSAEDSVVGMESSDMQIANFVTTLNKASYAYNDTKPTVTACGWVAVDSDYPTLDFSTSPTSSGGVD